MPNEQYAEEKRAMNTLSPFEKRWLKLFASDISKSDIKKYVLDAGFIWHVFSWELKPEGSFLVGEDARQAFDRADKTGASYYEPFSCNSPHEAQYDSPSAEQLDVLKEIYVISSDNSWTYIKTHEGDSCGPYFYRIDDKALTSCDQCHRGDNMIYAAINEKGERYYTHLKKVFEAIKNRQRDYNWLISYAVCYPHDPDTARMLEQDYCWISGDDLTELVNRENFQWIWAVLSGFDKSIGLAEVLKYDLPFADGYEGFWQKPISIQHPLAKIEIVPWDSSLTLLFSREKEIVDDFRKFFLYSENLENYIDRE